MIGQTLRHIAVYGVSLPTFAVSPAVAKATVYMPSQVAARVFGGRPVMHGGQTIDENADASDQSATNTSHAA
jgi:hypothetical protein